MEKYKVEYLQNDNSDPQYIYNDLRNFDGTGSTWKKKESAEKYAKAFIDRLQKSNTQYYSVRVIADQHAAVEQAADQKTIQEEEPSEKENLLSSSEILSDLKAWSEIIEHLEEYKKKYFAILHEEDMRQQDILHYIELHSVNAARASKLVKMLHESRIRRREAKNMLETLGNLNQAIEAGHKTSAAMERIEERRYTPRVEKELFENK